jgi:hypothetical protein
MKTKQQYADECRAAHPKPIHHTTNGVQVELTDDEYEMMIENWAIMRLHQDNPELQPKATFGATA